MMNSGGWHLRRMMVVSLMLFVGGCRSNSVPSHALDLIDPVGLAKHIRTLASDAFEGREPTSRGEDLTIEYMTRTFQDLGLEPGNGNSWVQEVPMVSITSDPEMTLSVERDEGVRDFSYGSDFVAWTQRVIDMSVIRESEMVFVGYGIVAPEYGWDDYEGIDVRGETVIVLVNDPGFATASVDQFNGRSMTYYGRWSYKYEEAARQGAAGVFIVHDTEAAGYPWEVVVGSWSGPQFGLVAEDANLSRASIEGWLTQTAAAELFGYAGLTFSELAERAADEDFEAVPLKVRANIAIRTRVERSVSNNVAGRIMGSQRPDEVVVYIAHWDHLGRDESLEGDQIFNGALDNATGTAGLIEVAEAFTLLDPAPARSVLFLAVTAEEQGLLGSAYYGDHPLYPLNKTVAAINMDGLNTLGPTNDITIIGLGNSELDTYLETAALAHGRVVKADPEPEKGYFYRSDHFNFAKQGVPALYTHAGIDHVELGEEYGRDMRGLYVAERYHKPTDEYDGTWDLDGAVDDLRLLFEVGYRLTQGSDWPNWAEDNEFRAARDQMMGDVRTNN
jgi:Zn-dependent M28 family amino/carboxypeptidase